MMDEDDLKVLTARIESLENMMELLIKAMENQNKTIDVVRGQINSLELSRKKEPQIEIVSSLN